MSSLYNRDFSAILELAMTTRPELFAIVFLIEAVIE
jgi:hypothetical protein